VKHRHRIRPQRPITRERARCVGRQGASFIVIKPTLGQVQSQVLPLVLGMVVSDQKVEPRLEFFQARNAFYRLDLLLAGFPAQAKRPYLLGREVPQRIQAISRKQKLISPHFDQRAGVCPGVGNSLTDPSPSRSWLRSKV